MNRTITFTVNGQSRTVTTDPGRSLLEVLREDLHLTGTKYGCGEGECRSCTVLVGGREIASCVASVGSMANKEIQTIEGLANGDKLHPVQEAFLAENAFQCGTCTPGMILGTVALLKEKSHPTDTEIRAHLQKHICRCCAYPNIVRAVKRAAQNGRAA